MSADGSKHQKSDGEVPSKSRDEVAVERGPLSTDSAIQDGRGRLLYLALGWAFFGLGLIGVLLPVVPSTPFMILAVWAFSKSSKRFEHWLTHHRWFGPSIVRWKLYRVVPLQAKLLSWGAMSVTFTASIVSGKVPWWGLLGQGLLMGYGAWFIARCPSRVPNESTTGRHK